MSEGPTFSFMNMMWILKLAVAPVLGFVLMFLPFAFTVKAITTPDILEAEAPGTAPFEISEGGSYTLWRVSAGVVNSSSEFRVEEEELPPGLSLHIRRVDNGTTVPLKESLGSKRSSSGSPTKTSLVKADLTPGKYELISSTNGEPESLALSKSVGSFRGFMTGVGTFFLGLVVFLTGLVYALVAVLRKVTASRSIPPAPPVH